MDDTNKIHNFSKKTNLLLLIILFVVFAVFIIVNNQIQRNNAPENSGAIFGGRLESGYEFSGYILSDMGTSLKICSAVLISPTQAVTAAHCLDNDGEKFVGIGNYTANRENYHTVKSVIIHPDWKTYNKAESDFGIIIIDEPIALNQYAEIAAPSTGCDFVVVGYGKQDNSADFTPLRKSTDVCIESTNYLDTSISFTGRDGGLCFGDSGSGIFIKDTNKFITIASSIDSCYINNFAVGAQIFGKINAKDSSIQKPVNGNSACGYIDEQNNGIVDNFDLDAFADVYLKYCSDTSDLDSKIQCGPKDSNQDNVVNLIDFSHFAEVFAKGNCD